MQSEGTKICRIGFLITLQLTDLHDINVSLLDSLLLFGVYILVPISRLFFYFRYDGNQDLATAEYYNPRVNKWSRITSMGTKRSCLGTKELNSQILN